LVTVAYWFGDSPGSNATMGAVRVALDGDGVYGHVVPSLPISPVLPLHYRFWATDSWGNTNSTPVVTVAIIDILPSTFVSCRWTEPTTGDAFRIDVIVTDNAGLASLSLDLRLDDGTGFTGPMARSDVLPNGNGAYYHERLMPDSYTGSLRFNITAVDTSGNSARMEQALRVRDNDAPSFDNEMASSPAVKGLDVRLGVSVWDNVGVRSASLTYWFGTGAPATQPLHVDEYWGWDALVRTPRHPGGDMHYYFSATDDEGNLGRTPTYSKALVNLPPTTTTPFTLRVVESQITEMSLRTFVVDDNDDQASLDLRLKPGQGPHNVTVSGLSLTALYDDWVPEHNVTLIISDGEDAIEWCVTVIVLNVNDPPDIPVILAPVNGTSALEGTPLEFIIHVWDPDIPYGDELDIVWVSTIDGTFHNVTGHGEVNLSYGGLSPGRHVIMVRASDGVASSSAQVEVVVVALPEAPVRPPFYRTPWGVLIIVLLIVLAMSAIVIYRYLREGRLGRGT